MDTSPQVTTCFPHPYGTPLLETGEYFEWSPSIDISETRQAYLIRAALPAMRKEDLGITYRDRVLTLSSASRVRQGAARDFTCSVELPAAIDAGAIEVGSSGGLLTLRVPKTAPQR
jgi:HSP20 family protein